MTEENETSKRYKNIEAGKLNWYFDFCSNVELKKHKVLCSIGIHDWRKDSIREFLTKGKITKSCFYCSAQK